MNPNFRDSSAVNLWNAYFSDVERTLRTLGEDPTILCQDLKVHVVDSMSAQSAMLPEIDRLEVALRRLGRPDEYLPALNVVSVRRSNGLRATLERTLKAASAAVLSAGQLLMYFLVVLAVLKPFWSDHVGLFRLGDDSFSFGVIAQTSGMKELLGWWLIPLALTVALYLRAALPRRSRG